jgi:hypothetical protein
MTSPAAPQTGLLKLRRGDLEAEMSDKVGRFAKQELRTKNERENKNH